MPSELTNVFYCPSGLIPEEGEKRDKRAVEEIKIIKKKGKIFIQYSKPTQEGKFVILKKATLP